MGVRTAVGSSKATTLCGTEQRAGDLHELPVGDGEVRDLRSRIDAVPSSTQDRAARARAWSCRRRNRSARISRPRNTFCATVRSAASRISWCTRTMPVAFRIHGPVNVTGWPFRCRLPFVGARWPERMRISVDLPAPFSPMTAWTSPGFRSNEMPLRTSIGPKDFEMLSARRDRIHARLRMSDIVTLAWLRKRWSGDCEMTVSRTERVLAFVSSGLSPRPLSGLE